MPVRAAGGHRRVFPALSRGAAQHLSQFQPQDHGAAGGRRDRRGHPDSAGKSPSLKSRPIFRDHLQLMVAANHPFARLKRVPVSQAAREPFIYPKTGYTRELLDKLFRPYASTLQVRMELPSVGMI